MSERALNRPSRRPLGVRMLMPQMPALLALEPDRGTGGVNLRHRFDFPTVALRAKTHTTFCKGLVLRVCHGGNNDPRSTAELVKYRDRERILTIAGMRFLYDARRPKLGLGRRRKGV